jgi:hypothetical protein
MSQLTVGRLSIQCGILNVSQPNRPLRSVRSVTGMALPFFTFYCMNHTQTINVLGVKNAEIPNVKESGTYSNSLLCFERLTTR